MVDLVILNNYFFFVFYLKINVNRNIRVMFEVIESFYDFIVKKYSFVWFFNEWLKCLYLKENRIDYYF